MEQWELIARESIRDTVARYNHAGDSGRYDDMIGCFTVDGVLAGTPTAIWPVSLLEGTAPERNSYDLRLVIGRTLYDQAIGTATSPSLAHLPRGSAVHLHPLDLARVGTSDGVDVKVRSARATVVLPVVADASVLRGTAWMPWNNPGPNVGELIDCFAAINDVRIENL